MSQHTPRSPARSARARTAASKRAERTAPARKRPRNVSRRLGELLQNMKDCARSMRTLAAQLREHKQQQEQVRREMDYFALGQKITRTGSWAWNVSSGELFWSREHFRLFGLPPENTQISYRTFLRMVHAEEQEQVDRAFRAAVQAGRDFDTEYRIVRRDGLVRLIHSRACPVFGESGELTEYVGTVADITERRRGEDSLGSMQADLARASRAITVRQLMATIAHEVNQPLTGLLANAGAARRWLAADPPRIDKTRQALARIVRDGNRASDVIARIRSLVGSTAVERNPLSLNSLVQEVIVLVRTELRRNNITVRTHLDGDLPPVHCDRVQMQQVLLNLFVNAIEAMSSIEKRSRLLAIRTLANVTGALVCVEDNGIGLDEQDLERVFEPFYTTKPRGMGIGLAISRTIIEAHGGRLWAEPNAALGTTFHFQLPLNRITAS
jgi:PAS domain S-box-containing protein